MSTINMTIPSKPIPVAAYQRFSSNMQHETSIEYQDEAIEAYCRQNNMVIVQKYVDRAHTGIVPQRSAFQQMLRDAADNPEWKAVIIYDLSRFSRDVGDTNDCWDYLLAHNISLISVLENLSTTPDGRMSATITSAFNQRFSADLALRVHRAQKVLANKGQTCGGIAPLGYDIKDGKLVINPYEAQIVKEIFSCFLAGISYTCMAEKLNAKGYHTKSGNPFTKQSFKDLGITYEEKAFYDILIAVAKQFGFDYPTDKAKTLAEEIKKIVDDKSKYTDWSKRDDIKAELKMDLILILAEYGYPPVTNDEVFKEIFEQAENFKKYN